ncbi:MAG: M56 family metallopeptidase [Pseudohongiellaceae bacterium]
MLIIIFVSLALRWNLLTLDRLTAEARLAALWWLVLTPWLIGVSATGIVMLLSSPEVSGFTGSDFIHWHHPSAFALNSWHGYFVFAMVALVFVMGLSVARRLREAASLVKTLELMSIQRPDGVMVLDTDIPAAFTAGMMRPRCYMTSALIAALKADEYAIIRFHEMVHVRRGDPSRKMLFQLLAAFYPSRIAQILNSQMAVSMEQSADTIVAGERNDRAGIARTLLKVRRLVMSLPHGTKAEIGVCHFGLDDIESRIRYLLAEYKGNTLPVFPVLVLLLIAAAVCATGADAVHHAVEISMQHS